MNNERVETLILDVLGWLAALAIVVGALWAAARFLQGVCA